MLLTEFLPVSAVVFEPWSKCMDLGSLSLRRHTAINSASKTISLASVDLIHQSMNFLEYKSRTTVRYDPLW
ncbi:hypothetical protein MKX19_16315 [Acinetobacter pittii]|uniref:hypothetical protein n=1 Tax=Acinetobacter sp. BS1 TaxID=2024618 RepID=UPI000F73CB2B|nr:MULTISPECIES: hypothetical protein [Acinetobacter]MDR0066920.1 hypothetical protein [Acinetobacter sp. 11520]MBT1524471.1 hypothetical protein [Acinetobacter pittii]MCG6639287.1 hypothetical protein [Acinetobacter baumannii]MCH2013640.1 hypothetical protein [Acinetobacter pittii]MCH2052843.1 hypothetical protein [Acinetobacter pittii]